MFYVAGNPKVTFSTIPEMREGGTEETSTVKYEFSDVFRTSTADFSFFSTIKVCEEDKARILGFKSVAAMDRFYRRIKRKKEQERRRRLKEGSNNA